MSSKIRPQDVVSVTTVMKWRTEPGKGVEEGRAPGHLMTQEGGQTEEIQVEEFLEPGLFLKNQAGMVSGYSGPK